MRGEFPTGTVTFLFTDVEGSTKLLHELGPEGYAQELAGHRRILREAFMRHGGVEVDTQGDAFFYAFANARQAAAAAAEGNERLAYGAIRVRVGLHTGQPHLSDEGYVGEDVHLGARIAASGHGGQVVVSAATASLLDQELEELGEHRLKDFSEPVPLFQLGAERFPPLKTISNTNLPRPASSFVGRERELAEVSGLLREGARLLTLSGPGGSGKTRLAIEAAAEVVPEFKAGVFWVPLATIRDPALVADTIAQTLGAKDGLAEHIQERELLLLLDNLEQVVEAAPELGQLLESCPNLKLLVTSRELLRVRGEVEYSVPPLSDAEAVSLFCERAQLGPDETIAELCRRLDNLPLALELAAARTNVLSPAQILERLAKRLDLLKGGRDAEARQQTLRAAIEWSHELLDAEEQQLFARLSVFAGGCTLEAAEEVAGADLDVLQSLVDKSLVRHTHKRFWMLETIREYALERLQASGEADDLGRRHAEYFLALAEEAEPHLRDYDDEWLARVDAAHDNLRAALEHLAAASETQLLLRLVGALGQFWEWRNEYLREGRRYLRVALDSDEQPTPARAKALTGAVRLAITASDTAEGKARAPEAIRLHRSFGDQWSATFTMQMLGHALMQEADAARVRGDAEGSANLLREAAEHQEEAIRRLRALGDDANALDTKFNLAWTYFMAGREADAATIYDETLEEARRTGDAHHEAYTLGALAFVHGFHKGDPAYALPLLRDALRIARQVSDHFLIAVNLSRVAHALALLGASEHACLLQAVSSAAYEALGAKPRPWAVEQDEKTLAILREALDAATLESISERGRTMPLDEALELVLRDVVADA